MKPAVAKRLRLLASALSVVAVVVVLVVGWFYSRLRASLPTLDGTISGAALSAPVTVERDALGVPTIIAKQRLDATWALGFLHGQDRFFQMDLMRRRPAGELSALIGKATLEVDKHARLHGFRKLAQTVVAQLPEEQKALLDAYAAGVNAGLSRLGAKPFEYLLLRADPVAWKPEDTILIIYAMTLDLQDEDGGYEQSLAAVRDVLGAPALAYFAPLIGPEDAALDGSLAPLSPMPSERYIDLRNRNNGDSTPTASLGADDMSVMLGSNGFALAGTRTATGAGMLANDMHLSLRLPNIWYRASLAYTDVSGEAIRVTGVTLPGAPAVVAGSNGQIAWGFTNANADMSDLVTLEISTVDRSVYVHGKELLQMERRKEIIEVKGGDPVEFEADWTIWGPVVGQSARGRPYALHWTAHDPKAANYTLIELERAKTVEDGISIAHRSGIPIQNFVVADASGKIGWTICGMLPKRFGFDGRLPVSWAFDDRGWSGFLTSEEIPSVIAPAAGQIWTANQRILNSEALIRLGDGGYDRAQRAARIRDLLTPIQNAQPKDLLAVQLDAGAPHLERWHTLMEKVLTEPVQAQNKDRARIKAALTPWTGRADADSVSYRLVRSFRRHVVARVLPPIFARCAEVYPDFSYRRFHYDPALFDMFEKRPAHLLNPEFSSWDELLIASVDDVIAELKKESVSIEKATWGQQNTAKIQHPFAKLVSAASAFLSMPRDPLSGDYDTPRVQAPDDGASERFVVSPGHEDQGIFEMPGGQSGHPLSPYWKAGHEAWVRGDPTPFLPGPKVNTLTLTP
jgi:penicillin G amidase